MADKHINKVIYGGQTLITLEGDTIEASDVINGKTFHHKSGEIQTGTCSYDADTSDATASASEILVGQTAYVSGSKVTGTMPNNASDSSTISAKAQQVTIAQGYHDGSGKVSISTTEQAKIIAGNIKDGVQILGVTGNYTGEGVTSQTKTVIPSASWTTDQSIIPDANYDFLAEVVVKKIPYVESVNAAGGYTVTIG